MQLRVDGAARPLPASRKTRALLAWLALEPRRHRRERLCELLWDIPDDPRAALRWSLTKLRPLLDRPDRLQASREDVALDTQGMQVDVADVRAALATGVDRLSVADLEALFAAACQPFLEDSDLPAQPLFNGWIGAIRHEMTEAAQALGEALLARPLPAAAQLGVLARLIAADPHDAQLHARRIALLEAERDPAALAEAVRAARALVGEVSKTPAADLAAAAGRLAPTASAAHARGVLARIIVQPFAATGNEAIAVPLAGLLASGVAGSLARFGNLDVTEAQAAAPGAYAVAGDVLQAGDRVKVRARLATPAGALLWSEELVRLGQDLLSLEDDITSAIVAALEPRIRFSEAFAARSRPAASPDDLFLLALGHMMGDGDFTQAQAHLEQALARDPDHGLSGAYLPWVAIQTGSIASADGAARYAAMARHAVHCAPRDVMVQSIGGLMMLLLGHDFDGALDVIGRAARLHPQAMFPHMARGWARVHGGDSEGALADFETAEALARDDPTDNSINAGRALACFQLGALEDARQWVQRSLARSRTSLEAMRMGVAIAVEQGRLDEARRMAGELRLRNPGERAGRARLMPFRQPGVADRLFAAWRAAGIPD